MLFRGETAQVPLCARLSDPCVRWCSTERLMQPCKLLLQLAKHYATRHIETICTVHWLLHWQAQQRMQCTRTCMEHAPGGHAAVASRAQHVASAHVKHGHNEVEVADCVMQVSILYDLHVRAQGTGAGRGLTYMCLPDSAPPASQEKRMERSQQQCQEHNAAQSAKAGAENPAAKDISP